MEFTIDHEKKTSKNATQQRWLLLSSSQKNLVENLCIDQVNYGIAFTSSASEFYIPSVEGARIDGTSGNFTGCG